MREKAVRLMPPVVLSHHAPVEIIEGFIAVVAPDAKYPALLPNHRIAPTPVNMNICIYSELIKLFLYDYLKK
jgi:hypothetical protein